MHSAARLELCFSQIIENYAAVHLAQRVRTGCLMKMKFIAISAIAAALVVPASARADDNDKNLKGKADEKVTEANQKTHEKICQGHHGTVTAKTDSSITVDGKQYALTADTQVNKQGESLISKSAKVGDTVTVRAPRGPERVEIIAVRYDDLRSGVRDNHP